MPWKETKVDNERIQFIQAYEASLFSITELCANYNISRPTAYKWIDRYLKEGFAGLLSERSRAPKTCPHKTDQLVCEALIALKHAHPSWGARKLLASLEQNRASLAELLCAPSTATSILKAAGLVTPKKRRAKPIHPGYTVADITACNQLWNIDFKGEFLTKDGRYCYPLTITDAYSRYILCCEGKLTTCSEGAQEAMIRLFREVGLPDMIRSDNGNPFCTVAMGGFSRLNLFWLKLGIMHQRIERGKPQQNGSHERMHRTLKEDTTRPPSQNLSSQQIRFDHFRDTFNNQRPHESLDMKTPSTLWTPSLRPYPSSIPEPEYDGHMEIRKVRHTGEIRFKGNSLFLSEVFKGENIALEEVDEGIWSILFYNTMIAKLDLPNKRIVSAFPKILAANNV